MKDNKNENRAPGRFVRLRRQVVGTVRKRVRDAIPAPMEALIHKISLLRVSKSVTALLGTQYKPNPHSIEIDITHRCQLSCLHCNRSCGPAPSDECMTLGQLEKFISESREARREWKEIVVLGGEPTLHPQFLEMMDLLVSYKRMDSPRTKLCVKSNGCGTRTRSLLAQLPPEVMVENSEKNSNLHSNFASFNIAPIDLPEYANSDYRNGCRFCTTYGMGLTWTGYYPCAVGGGIDRVIGAHAGRKSLPPVSDQMKDQLDLLCRYCGHFKRQFSKISELKEMSSYWKKAYSDYKKNPPTLERY